jgi:hypothetical protein
MGNTRKMFIYMNLTSMQTHFNPLPVSKLRSVPMYPDHFCTGKDFAGSSSTRNIVVFQFHLLTQLTFAEKCLPLFFMVSVRSLKIT